MSIVYNQ